MPITKEIHISRVYKIVELKSPGIQTEYVKTYM